MHRPVLEQIEVIAPIAAEPLQHERIAVRKDADRAVVAFDGREGRVDLCRQPNIKSRARLFNRNAGERGASAVRLRVAIVGPPRGVAAGRGRKPR